MITMRGIGSFPHRFAVSPQYVNPSRGFGASTYSIRLSASFVYFQSYGVQRVIIIDASVQEMLELPCFYAFAITSSGLELGKLVR